MPPPEITPGYPFPANLYGPERLLAIPVFCPCCGWTLRHLEDDVDESGTSPARRLVAWRTSCGMCGRTYGLAAVHAEAGTSEGVRGRLLSWTLTRQRG